MKVSPKRKFQFIVASAIFSGFIPIAAQAQTKPDTQTPRLDRSEARAMINQLLREGKIMRADSAKRGMRGIGRSVFQGGKIEEFKIEVIGTLKKVMGGGDLVLIKVLDGPVVKRQSGIIAGMSGSPVYINGKMLGAIAIGFGFPKEPIGGVTPITQMIEGALPDNAETKRTASVTTRPTKQHLTTFAPETYRAVKPLAIGGQRFSQVVVSRDFQSSAKGSKGLAMPGALVGRPCNMLMQLSGFSPASLPRLKQMFEPWGIEPVIGTGGAMKGPMAQVQAFSSAGNKTDANPPFVPGGAIGVPLVTGDLDMSGVGTITFRWGKRILAFGHPMFGKGAVSMPMTSAYIHDIFPSYQQSFKLASPVREVGALQQDTEFAIGGTIGRRADMVPMHVRLKNAERGIDRSYNVRLIKDPLFTPMLLQMVGAETLAGAFGMDSDKMVRVKFRMQLEGLPAVEKQDFLYAQS
ncbi:MAG TPA: SpoIVB peptidase S55 domain-containing protein, partial [Abditibacteriaceae bacterium]